MPVDIRIIAATHQHLDQYIVEGKFREDLYYRINVIPSTCRHCGAGRGRGAADPLLLNLHTSRIGIVYPGLAPEVMALLKGYRWPGNVRELSNLIEYLVNVSQAGEVIDASLLPPTSSAIRSPIAWRPSRSR